MEIVHPNGQHSMYAHLADFAIGSGTVVRGQLLGTSGNSGNSFGAHLHYEERNGSSSSTRTDPQAMFAMHGSDVVTYPGALGPFDSWDDVPCGRQSDEPDCSSTHTVRNDGFGSSGPPVDSDNDGVPDDSDQCPTAPGDPNTGGCPNADGDDFADKDDLCPNTPGPRATQGCPDRDGDGTADIDDDCPDDPGPANLGGCPDSDGDGVRDIDDLCPLVFGLANNRGCPLEDSSRQKGDFTGDRREDLIVAVDDGGSGTDIYLLRSLGSRFAEPVLWSALPQFEWAKSKIVVGDFDRDRRADVMVVYDDGGSTSFHFFRSGRDRALDPVVWGSELQLEWAKSKVVAADFTGDARADLLVTHDEEPGATFHLFRSLGKPFGPSETWSDQPEWDWAKTKLVAGDYSGDGKADLAVGYDSGGNVETRVLRSVGNAFAAPATWRSTQLGWARSKLVTGDFDGDKRPDVGVFYDDDPGVSFTFLRAVKNGFDVPKSWTSQSGWSWGSSKVIAADVTGDLRADVVVLYDADPGVTARSFRSLRSSLAAPVDWLASSWDWAATKVA